MESTDIYEGGETEKPKVSDGDVNSSAASEEAKSTKEDVVSGEKSQESKSGEALSTKSHDDSQEHSTPQSSVAVAQETEEDLGEKEADASDSEDNKITLGENEDKIVVFDAPPEETAPPAEDKQILHVIEAISEQQSSIPQTTESTNETATSSTPATHNSTTSACTIPVETNVVAPAYTSGTTASSIPLPSDLAPSSTSTHAPAAADTPAPPGSGLAPSGSSAHAAAVPETKEAGVSGTPSTSDSTTPAPSGSSITASSAPSVSSTPTSGPLAPAASDPSASTSVTPTPATSGTTPASAISTSTGAAPLASGTPAPPIAGTETNPPDRKMDIVRKVEGEEVIYSGDVTLKKDRTTLTLKPSAFIWSIKGVVTLVILSTVIGVTHKTNTFTVHACIAKKEKREPRTFTFVCKDEEAAKAWHDTVHNQLNPSTGGGPAGRRVSFLVNPFSGTKKASAVYTQLVPLFEAAGIKITLIETQRSGHAREIGQSIDPDTVDAVVCVSGDGLLNELINGMLDRDDWRRATQIPIGIIPAGSGNGLAYTLGTSHPVSAALNIIKGFSRPFDLLGATQRDADGKEIKSFHFLDLTWGMISDIDIESEKNRWMGGIRFTVGACKRVLNLRKYKGRLSYLQAEKAERNQCVDYNSCERCNVSPGSHRHPDTQRLPSIYAPVGTVDVRNLPPEWITIEDEFVIFIATNVSWIGADFMASRYAHLSDGAIDIILVREQPNLSRPKLANLLIQGETGECIFQMSLHIDNPLVEHLKVKAYYLEPGPLVAEKKAPARNGLLVCDGEVINSYTPLAVECYRGLLKLICRE